MAKFSTLRNPVTNVRFTKSLFRECQQEMMKSECPFKAPYSLYNDYEGAVNFRKVYVELGDPTGFKLANMYLEDYDHWRMLMKCKWFVVAKERWDDELDARLSSEGLEVLKMFSDGVEGVAPAIQLQAAKYLADKMYRKPRAAAPARGRPSKEEIAGNLKNESFETAQVADDLARIRSVK